MRRLALIFLLMSFAVLNAATGSIGSPVPTGQTRSFQTSRTGLSGRRGTYEVSLTVNGSQRGETVMNERLAYEERRMSDISMRDEVFKFDYVIPWVLARYIPAAGCELIAISVTFRVDDSDSPDALEIDPLDFTLSTGSGRKLSTSGMFPMTWHDYEGVLSCELYPGGEETGWLVYEVPQEESVLLGYGQLWFSVT